MPSPAIVITWESLSRYPQLRSFLESNPPDSCLLKGAGYQTEYKVALPTNRYLQRYSLFQILSLFGKTLHIEALKLTDIQQKAAVMSDDYLAIQNAAQNGHLDTLKHLEKHLSLDEQKAVVKAHTYLAIQNTAQNGHLDTLKHLETRLSLDEQKAAVKAYGCYKTIRYAAHYRHLDTVHHLLQYTNALNYFEKSDYEYGQQFTYAFVDGTINELQLEKAAFEANTPNRVYNVSEPKAQQCFYLLRNLIRRGVARNYSRGVPGINRPAERREDDLRFLLSIPAVRDLCHQVVTVDEESPGEENELLKLALHINNAPAAALLIQLPDVRRLAEQQDFYRLEARGDMDLRRIAQDRESSMVALSQTEQRLLHNVTTHYKPVIDAKGGVLEVISEFKTWLETEYEKHPARIQMPLSGDAVRVDTMELPFEWEALQALRSALTEAQYDEALQAYYANDVHTAYRYLSKPNHWMHPRASFVYVNEARTERWSTFEEYLPIIAPFYLAAFDKHTPAIDGYTLASRQWLFVKELALIGRAHNWDHRNAEGEEYDDKTADKPSCYSGVKRRLWQSVLGHPMFQVLKEETLRQALMSFTHQWFKARITPDNVAMVRGAYHRVLRIEDYETSDTESAQSADIALLTSFNIDEPSINAFRDKLDATYAGQLTGNLEFLAQFNAYFQLTPETLSLHIMRSSTVESLFEALSTEEARARVSRRVASGFFSASTTGGLGAEEDGASAISTQLAKI